MPDLNLKNAYNPTGVSVHDLFDRTEEGFFVPLYQREYTWEQDNINQLFEDIVFGIRELTNDDGDNATTFLGTVILSNLTDKSESVVPGEENAQPTAVRLVIDGQQRISTLSLLAIQLLIRIKTLCDHLSDDSRFKVLQDHCVDLSQLLEKLYTMRLGRGADPPFKPKLITAKDDRWTYNGDDISYRSPVAHYTARYIRESSTPQAALADPQDPTTIARVRGNIELINQWLDDICDAHITDTQLYDQYPVGAKISKKRIQEYVLGFNDQVIQEIIEKSETNQESKDYFGVALFHIYLFAYYLLRRCGVNCLQPTREEWGFDMFQALNATGTPLTVMETFLPQVMQAEQRAGNNWTHTPSCEYMEEIDKLFGPTTSNVQKNSRTNDLVRTFALCYDGEKLGDRFSTQRRWISQIFEKDLQPIESKHRFLQKLASVAEYYRKAWYMEEVVNPHMIVDLEDHPEGKLASLLVQYLKDANSKLSAPILTRFYIQGLEQGNMDGFVEASKACAAFFTLWRSTSSTSGLDNVYRQFFKGSNGPVVVGKYNWKNHPSHVTVSALKQYFKDVLKRKEVLKKDNWISSSERFLVYPEVKSVCRFVLFVAGHDRMVDADNPGLTLPATPGFCPLLNLESWKSKAYSSLEHVAPQSPPSEHSWDKKIYTENRVHDVGNLLLLPTDINRLVASKGWRVKYLHYCHVGRSQNEIEQLRILANHQGINLSRRATKILSESEYSCAVEPILALSGNGNWNAGMINKRTLHIKELAWETLSFWLR